MYTGWRGRTLAPLISTVFVATVGTLSGKTENADIFVGKIAILSGNAENLSGKAQILSGNQSIHCEKARFRIGSYRLIPAHPAKSRLNYN